MVVGWTQVGRPQPAPGHVQAEEVAGRPGPAGERGRLLSMVLLDELVWADTYVDRGKNDEFDLNQFVKTGIDDNYIRCQFSHLYDFRSNSS